MDHHLYHYVVVRKDMPIRKQLVHVGHAAGESASCYPDVLPSSTRMVIFHVANEGELLEISSLLDDTGIAHVKIHEPDGPEYSRGYVSLGLFPVWGAARELASEFFKLYQVRLAAFREDDLGGN